MCWLWPCRKTDWKVIAGTVVSCVVLAMTAIIIAYYVHQRARAKENTIKLTARMSGLEESEVSGLGLQIGGEIRKDSGINKKRPPVH